MASSSIRRLATLFLAICGWSAVFAAQACNPANSQLDAFTHAFTSDCNVTEWYPNNATLPRLCPSNSFCPDAGNACQDLLNVGGPCELNRDDQCLPPSIELQTRLSNPTNFNGSICLNLRCTYASMEEGETCEVDNTVYTGYAVDGSTFSDIVTRDNCATSLYCDPVALSCTTTLSLSSACSSDRECASSNCSPASICAPPSATPRVLGKWVYALVGIALLATMLTTVATLLVVDRRQKRRRRRERAEAWNEQRELRAAIVGLHRATGAKEGEEMKRAWSVQSSEW